MKIGSFRCIEYIQCSATSKDDPHVGRFCAKYWELKLLGSQPNTSAIQHCRMAVAHIGTTSRLGKDCFILILWFCVPFCNILYLVSYTSWPPSIYGPTCYIQTAHLSLSLALSNAVPCHFSWPSRYCLVPWRLSASRADFWAPLVRFLTGYQDFFPALRSIGLTYTHILRHVTVHAPCTNTKAVSWQNSAKSFPNTKHLSADEPLQGLAIPTTDVHIWNWDEAAAFTWQNTKATHGTLQWLHGMTHVSRTVVSPANTM